MFSCLDMKRTAETKTESKLGTGLEHKTLKFTDYAIFKFQSVFKVNSKKYYHLTNFIIQHEA